MHKILFVCYGNICRSPMGEFIMKDLVEKAGLSDEFYIESAATSSWEIGNPVYAPAKEELAAHGISCKGKRARQMTKADYGKFDLLIGMDNMNIADMKTICDGDPNGKIHMLMEYTARRGEVEDPWFTHDFKTAWDDIYEGCKGLLDTLIA